MWDRYQVTLQIENRLAASLPKTGEEIKAMLKHRMPQIMPENAIPIEELADIVAEKVETVEEEAMPGWATFPRNSEGLYYEGRCVRGHIKDCAQQLSKIVDIAAFKAKVANQVYVETDEIPLGKKEPDGTEKRFIQIMTRQGPRSTFKFIDYVLKPKLVFVLKVLEGGVIKEKHLLSIFEYGAVHGIGQERSQGWGRYQMAEMRKL